VLDPTADKTFAMGSHVLGFNFGVGTPDGGKISIDSVEQGGAIAFTVKTEENGNLVFPLAARFSVFASPVLGTNSGDIEGVRIVTVKGDNGSADNVTNLILESNPGSNATNAIGLDIRNVSGAANNWAIKTGLGLTQFGAVTGGTSGQLSYDPAASGSTPNLVLKGRDNSNMFRIFGGTGAAVPPQNIQFIGPSPSLTGAFSASTGSRVDMLSGNDGAAAPSPQDIFLHHDLGATTNGSGLTGNQVNLSMDAGDAQNPSGTKQAYAFQAIVTNSVNNGISQGFIADVQCSGTPCTSHGFNITSGDFGLNGSGGTSGQVFTSAGPNTIPTWTTPTAVPVAVTNFPSNVGTDTKTSQVAAIGSTTLLTTGGANAAYMAVVTLNCDTTSAAATVNVTLGWTDPGSQAQTQSLGSAIVCTALGSNSMGGFSFPFRAKASTNITYSTNIVNTPTYDISLVVYKITAN